jgi:hypothetical protein
VSVLLTASSSQAGDVVVDVREFGRAGGECVVDDGEFGGSGCDGVIEGSGDISEAVVYLVRFVCEFVVVFASWSGGC